MKGEKRFTWIVLFIGVLLSFWQMYRIIFGDFWAILSLVTIFLIMKWQLYELRKIEEKEWLEKTFNT